MPLLSSSGTVSFLVYGHDARAPRAASSSGLQKRRTRARKHPGPSSSESSVGALGSSSVGPSKSSLELDRLGLLDLTTQCLVTTHSGGNSCRDAVHGILPSSQRIPVTLNCTLASDAGDPKHVLPCAPLEPPAHTRACETARQSPRRSRAWMKSSAPPALPLSHWSKHQKTWHSTPVSSTSTQWSWPPSRPTQRCSTHCLH